MLHAVTRPLALLLTTLLASAWAFVAVAPTAHAVIFDTCVTTADNWSLGSLNPWRPPSGEEATASIIGKGFTAADDKTYFYGATGREWAGGNDALNLTTGNHVDGQEWSASVQEACEEQNGLTSTITRLGAGGVSGWLWNIGLDLNSLAATVLEFAQTAEIVSWFGDTIIADWQQGADTDGDGAGDGGGLNEFYWVGIAAVAGITVVYAIYLIGRERIKDAGRSFGWTVAAIVGGTVLLANPLLAPTIAQQGISYLGNGLSTIAIGAVGTAAGTTGDTSVCQLDESVNYPAGTAVVVNGEPVRLPAPAVREITCQFWQMTALRHYTEAQFGTTDTVPSVSDRDASVLAIPVPGLRAGTGPQPGDLVWLNLVTRNLTPAEQQWANTKAANEGIPVTSEAILTPLMGGNGSALNGTYANNDLAVYPANEIYDPYGGPTGVYALGHQERYELLVKEMSAQPFATYGAYTAIDMKSIDNRTTAGVGLAMTALSSTGAVGVFSIFSVGYQFILGLLLLLLPIILIGVALPGRAGPQIARDLFFKCIEAAVLAAGAMAMSILALAVTVAIPALLPWLQYSPWGTWLIGLVGLVFLLVLWGKVVKGFRSKASQSMGARGEGGALDIAGKASRAAKTTAVVGGAAAATVGAGIMTGGVSGAVLAAKNVSNQTARSLVYNNGRGVGSAITAGAKASIADGVANDVPLIDDEYHKENLKARQRNQQDRKQAATKRRLDKKYGEGNHDYKTDAEKKQESAASANATPANSAAPNPEPASEPANEPVVEPARADTASVNSPVETPSIVVPEPRRHATPRERTSFFTETPTNQEPPIPAPVAATPAPRRAPVSPATTPVASPGSSATAAPAPNRSAANTNAHDEEHVTDATETPKATPVATVDATPPPPARA